jgi:hypothetical protein
MYGLVLVSALAICVLPLLIVGTQLSTYSDYQSGQQELDVLESIVRAVKVRALKCDRRLMFSTPAWPLRVKTCKIWAGSIIRIRTRAGQGNITVMEPNCGLSKSKQISSVWPSRARHGKGLISASIL